MGDKTITATQRFLPVALVPLPHDAGALPQFHLTAFAPRLRAPDRLFIIRSEELMRLDDPTVTAKEIQPVSQVSRFRSTRHSWHLSVLHSKIPAPIKACSGYNIANLLRYNTNQLLMKKGGPSD